MKKLLFVAAALFTGHVAATQTWWLNVAAPYYWSIPTPSYVDCRKAMVEYASEPTLEIYHIGCDVQPLREFQGYSWR